MKEQAQEFFRQLQVFSDRYVKALGLDTSKSPWGAEHPMQPKGAIIHYTADEDLDRVLRWFLVAKFSAKAASHVVIADRKVGTHDKLAEDLPLIKELKATVIQCRPPNEVAWHATWCNDTYYGIECINAGELKTDDGKTFHTWRPSRAGDPDWTAKWDVPYKTPQQDCNRWWEPYTQEQVHAVVSILRQVNDFSGNTLQRPFIVGHENVQATRTLKANGMAMKTDKRDCGPMFPIHGVRNAVFESTPVDHYDWYKVMDNPSQGGMRYVRNEMVRRVVVACNDTLMGTEMCWSYAQSELAKLTSGYGSFTPWGTLGLWLLGYYMPGLEHGEYTKYDLNAVLSAEECQSLKQFQICMGLNPDMKPGKLTRQALVERLKDRGIL